MVGLKLVTDYSLPSSGALSLARVKEHLRVTHTAEDDLLTGYLWGAIRYCEEVTGLSALVATYRQTIDRFPGSSAKPIRLLRNPGVSLTSVTYVDSNGVSQTTSAALLYSNVEPALLLPNIGEFWPADVSTQPAAVTITFTAGYASNALVPAMFVQAVHLLVGHWYANREDVVVGMTANTVPNAVNALLSLLKVHEYDYEPERSQ